MIQGLVALLLSAMAVGLLALLLMSTRFDVLVFLYTGGWAIVVAAVLFFVLFGRAVSRAFAAEPGSVPEPRAED
jgi:hypothetical protein